MAEGVAAVFKQVTHGQIVASVEPATTFTIQVQGVLIEPAGVDDTEGHVHLEQKTTDHLRYGEETPKLFGWKCKHTNVRQDSDGEL